ncbi:MAG TPA: hypothetical protein DGG94_06545 [Micromonosporaceae bacterium]|nr:hypothetical protein [Micromonosporaceae bacterium]HCU49448.1 hypothetical protein [Micromonosporaceae bacterium]
MANVSNYSASYEGAFLQPGQQHGWWMTHSNWERLLANFQVNVSAHPWVFAAHTPPPPQELMVTDLRSHINTSGGRVLYFNVRNTGPNPVRVYIVCFSFITD